MNQNPLLLQHFLLELSANLSQELSQELSQVHLQGLSQELSQQLLQVNQLLRAEVQWQLLTHTGKTNQLYTGRYLYHDVVLRLNTGSRVLGVCRERENSVLSLIRTYRWAPTILYLQMPDNSQSGWLLMGRYSELADEDIVNFNAKLLTYVAEWQQIKDVPLFNYNVLWDEYQQKIAVMGDARAIQVTLDSVRQLMQELIQGIPQVESCLVHHDLHAGNLLNSEEQLIVIDWEYAGLGTPWLDAAALVTEFSLSLKDVATLPSFSDIDLATFHKGIRKAQQINQQLNRLWHELR